MERWGHKQPLDAHTHNDVVTATASIVRSKAELFRIQAMVRRMDDAKLKLSGEAHQCVCLALTLPNPACAMPYASPHRQPTKCHSVFGV